MTSADAVPAWLSDEWVEEVARLAVERPVVDGVNATVVVSISRGGRGSADVRYHWRYRDGVPGEGTAGAPAEADLSLAIAAGDAADILRGAVEPSVSYMRGRLKPSGDDALLLRWLASTTTSAFGSWRRRVASLSGLDPAGGGPAA